MSTTTLTAEATSTAGFACGPCAGLIAYGDESATPDPERVGDVEATAAAIARDGGGSVAVIPAPEDAEDPGYFRCALCGDDVLGVGGVVLVIHD